MCKGSSFIHSFIFRNLLCTRCILCWAKALVKASCPPHTLEKSILMELSYWPFGTLTKTKANDGYWNFSLGYGPTKVTRIRDPRQQLQTDTYSGSTLAWGMNSMESTTRKIQNKLFLLKNIRCLSLPQSEPYVWKISYKYTIRNKY
jgi:hypothetical protein